MGSDDEQENAKPQHQVHVDIFWIDKYEVTNAEYKEFVDATGHPVPYVQADWAERFNWGLINYTFPAGRENHPVVLVSWNDALAYCEWRGKRLPTEAEWEKAARGTDGRRYPWGNEWFSGDAPMTNILGVRDDTAQVGTYPQDTSPYGAMDLAGNAAEWVSDSYQPYPNSSFWTKDYEKGYKAIRGGSWLSPGRSERISSPNELVSVDFGHVTTAHRWGARRKERFVSVGFRCAR
jgi:formylglycine-generating enzyme required for sulfatase activity